MKRLRVKYWAGWHSIDNMDNPGYLESWKGAVQKADDEGMELNVFRLPKNSRAVEMIERLLQEHFGEPSEVIDITSDDARAPMSQIPSQNKTLKY